MRLIAYRRRMDRTLASGGSSPNRHAEDGLTVETLETYLSAFHAKKRASIDRLAQSHPSAVYNRYFQTWIVQYGL